MFREKSKRSPAVFFVLSVGLAGLLFIFVVRWYSSSTGEGEASYRPTTQTAPAFRLHLTQEPQTLDLTLQKGSGAHFLLNALHLPLFYSEWSSELRPGVLSHCEWLEPRQLQCHLVRDLRWSNGTPLTASDIVRTFQYFLSQKEQSLRPDLVENLDSVQAPDAERVVFELAHEDARFPERLSSPLLAPLSQTPPPLPKEAHRLVTSGPYLVESWDFKKKIRLKPNPFFQGHPERPPVEFLFVPEEATALLLYQQGQLDFLRRLPSAYMGVYSKTPDYHAIPLSRFDYVGFGPLLWQEPEIRKILSTSLNFENWRKILSARGRPGCFGIGLDILSVDPCLFFEEPQLPQWRKTLNTHPLLQDESLELHYSTLGGEDHRRSMEWLQNEWFKNLGLRVKVRGIDQALFQKELLETPPDLFRVGVALEHLSCANALEAFRRSLPPGSPILTGPLSEFFREWSQQNTNLTRPSSSRPTVLRFGESNGMRMDGPAPTERLCERALTELLAGSWLIPLGRIHIGILIRPQWVGWKLNPLNQLDLSQLHWVD